jgi:hypothetical protein
MTWKQPFNKTITFNAKDGNDQLGQAVGTPQVGDIAKIHLKGSYSSVRPLFKLGSIKVANKARTKEFISTHLAGETAFFELDMAKATFTDTSADLRTLSDLLALCVRDMVLGESATFAFDITGKSDIKDIVRNSGKLHRGHYASVPEDADNMVDLFRIHREDPSSGKRKSHFRIARNGYGG